MVRKGSPVRVRKRALEKPPHLAVFPLLADRGYSSNRPSGGRTATSSPTTEPASSRRNPSGQGITTGTASVHVRDQVPDLDSAKLVNVEQQPDGLWTGNIHLATSNVDLDLSTVKALVSSSVGDTLPITATTTDGDHVGAL